MKQDEIARGASTGLVKENDVLFAWHALVLTAVTLGQVYYYDVPPPIMTPMVRRAMWVVIVVLGMCAVRTWMVDARWDEDDGFVEHNAWTYLGFAIIVSFVKLGVSLVKYVPQAWLNYTRKSTEGFAIWNILLDFTGGMLSLMQLVYDASSEGDWTRVTDNPVKFGLGFVSIFFDILFMLQHNVWFRKPSSSKGYGTTDGSEYSRVTIDDDDESRGGDS